MEIQLYKQVKTQKASFAGSLLSKKNYILIAVC
jgi:hypothetical protein